MKEKIIFILLLSVSTITQNLKAQSNDSDIVIWSEDFTGYYDLPEEGKNAKYDYKGTSTQISFTNLSAAEKPELSIGFQNYFHVSVYLNCASGKLKLTFDVNDPQYVEIGSKPFKFNGKDKTLKLETIGKHQCSYTFDVKDGTKTLDIYFKRANQKNDVKIDNLRLTGPKGCRSVMTSPALSFSEGECTVFLNERLVLPVLRNPNTQEVHYFSSDPSIAEISKETGKITLKDVGETTISAVCYGGTGEGTSFMPNGYSYQEVSYKLIVKRRPPKGEIFYEGFSKTNDKGGYSNNYTAYTATTKDIAFDSSYSSISNVSCAYRCMFLGNNSVDGIYSIKPFTKSDSNKKYRLTFKVAGFGVVNGKKEKGQFNIYFNSKKTNPTKVNFTPCKWEKKEIVLPNVDENTEITFSGRNFYLDDVSVIIADYEEPIENVKVTISKYNYATLYYGDRALVIPEGMTAFSMKVVGDSVVVPSKVYNSGQTIPKGEAVLLKATPGNYEMVISESSNEVEKDEHNKLRGTDDTETTSGGDFYYLFGVDKETENIGFFWGEEDGSAFVNAAHKAYLPLVTSFNTSAKRNIPIHEGSNSTTRIRKIKAATDKRAYSLTGQPVGSNYRGIIIQDGKKILKK